MSQPWGPRAPQNPPPGGRRWLLLIAVFAAIALLVMWLIGERPGAFDDRDRQINLVYYGLWLVLLVPSLVLARRYSGRKMLRDAIGWIGIFAVVAVGYSFRNELGQLWARVAGEFMPQRGTAVGEGAMAFRAGQDGHFHVDAQVNGVNGVRVHFLVDTGASDVVLTEADARRLGLDLAKLSFSRVYRTANGEVLGAPVLLAEVRIGSIALAQVRASVSRGEMGQSLLGMSFLERLGGFSVTNGTLTLRQ